MTAFLLDEMFPTGTAVILRETYGHDAVHVAEIGLRGAEDAQAAATARAEGRAVVTENVADFASERDIVLASAPKKNPCRRWAGRCAGEDPRLLGTGSPGALPRPPLAGHVVLQAS